MDKGSHKEKKAARLWIFAEGGGVQPESKPFEELFNKPFFSLSLDIFKEKGGGEVKSKPYEEPFQLKFLHCPNFLRNFCPLDMRREKKFLEHVQRYRGWGVKAVQQKSKVELLFVSCGFPK